MRSRCQPRLASYTSAHFQRSLANFRPAPETAVIIYSRVSPENHAVADATRDTSSCDNLVAGTKSRIVRIYLRKRNNYTCRCNYCSWPRSIVVNNERDATITSHRPSFPRGRERDMRLVAVILLIYREILPRALAHTCIQMHCSGCIASLTTACNPLM